LTVVVFCFFRLRDDGLDEEKLKVIFASENYA